MRKALVAVIACHIIMGEAAANPELSLKTTAQLRRGSEMPLFGYVTLVHTHVNFVCACACDCALS
jgi:hypothetical protein